MSAPDFFRASSAAANLARHASAAAVASDGHLYEGLVWDEVKNLNAALRIEPPVTGFVPLKEIAALALWETREFSTAEIAQALGVAEAAVANFLASPRGERRARA